MVETIKTPDSVVSLGIYKELHSKYQQKQSCYLDSESATLFFILTLKAQSQSFCSRHSIFFFFFFFFFRENKGFNN